MSNKIKWMAIGLIALAIPAGAQPRASITATGDASVSANPDQATISVSVSTTAGLNVKTGNVIAASDGSTVSPLVTTPGLGAAASTPIVTGTVQVSASVRLQVEIVP